MVLSENGHATIAKSKKQNKLWYILWFVLVWGVGRGGVTPRPFFDFVPTDIIVYIRFKKWL